MTQHTVLASDSSNAIRSYDFPVLEAGNLSFPDGKYTITFEREAGGTSFVITHQIEGAPWLKRLLDAGDALYACTVSSPTSSYRDIVTSIEAEHKIHWDEDDLGEAPLLTPMIICAVRRTEKLREQRDGVHGIWAGRTVTIKKGNRLALGPVFQLQGSILHLLQLDEDSELAPGQFSVALLAENGLQFKVSLHPDLHRYLRVNHGDGARQHIMTHIVTACMALLQRDLERSDQDEEENGGPNSRDLMALEDFLGSHGLPRWDDEQFQPEKVATKLYPIRVPVPEEAQRP